MEISGDSYLFCGCRILPPHWEEVTFEELCWGHLCSLSSLWRVVGVAYHVVLGIWACVLPQESWPKSYFFFSWAVALYCIQSCIFSEERDESAKFQSPQFLFCFVLFAAPYNFPHQGLNLSPLQWECRVPTIEPPRKPQSPNLWLLWKRTWFINAFV